MEKINYLDYTYKNTFFADLETLTGESEDYKNLGHTEITFFHIRDINNKFIFEGATSSVLYNWIIKQPTFYMYFHNLSFDGYFIECMFYKHGFKFDNNADETKGYCFKSFKKNNDIYRIDIYRGKKAHYVFLCSKRLLSVSIETLGRNLSIAKKSDYINKVGYEYFLDQGSIYPEWENRELQSHYYEYCRRDVEILVLGYQKFIEKMKVAGFLKYRYFKDNRSYLRNVKITNFLTIGMFIKKVIDRQIRIQKQIKLKETKTQFINYKFYRQFVRGGLTQFNIKYQNKQLNERIVCLDINSSYPYQMTLPLPYGDMLDSPPEGEYLEFVIVDIFSAKIRKKWEHIPCLKNENNIIRHFRYYSKKYPAHEGTHYYLKKEWDLISIIYKIKYKSMSIKYTKCKTYLKDFVERLYVLKQNATSDSLTYKIGLNSLYGKTLQRQDFPNQLFADDETLEEFIKEGEIYINDKLHKVVSQNISKTGAIGTKLNHIKILPEKPNHKLVQNPLIGATITSYGRIFLLEHIMKLPRNTFVYCATDSIFFKYYKNWEKDFDMGDELGQWKLEGIYSSFMVNRANTYFGELENGSFKLGMGGVSRDTKVDYKELFTKSLYNNDEYINIENAVFRKVYDKYGIILTRVDKKIKIIGEN